MSLHVPEGYLTKSEVYATIRAGTGYGRMVIDNMLTKLEAEGSIHFISYPGHKQAKLLSKEDVDRVIKAFQMVAPPDGAQEGHATTLREDPPIS